MCIAHELDNGVLLRTQSDILQTTCVYCTYILYYLDMWLYRAQLLLQHWNSLVMIICSNKRVNILYKENHQTVIAFFSSHEPWVRRVENYYRWRMFGLDCSELVKLTTCNCVNWTWGAWALWYTVYIKGFHRERPQTAVLLKQLGDHKITATWLQCMRNQPWTEVSICGAIAAKARLRYVANYQRVGRLSM